MLWANAPWDMGYGWHFIPMLLWWGIMALIAVGLFRWVFRIGPRHRHHEDRALQIVRERFARGEITQEEFDRLRASLKL